jgi:hypothetical protein
LRHREALTGNRQRPSSAGALAVTDQLTVPLPLPLIGVHVSQALALLEAFHAQPALVVTVTLPLAAAAEGLALVGEIV